MAYYNAPLRGPKPITRIVCDPCADAGAVPFTQTVLSDGDIVRTQDDPWRWSPRFGATCDVCAAPC